MATFFALSPLTLVAVGTSGPVSGANVTITDRLSGQQITIYGNEQGTTTIAQPLASGSGGQIIGWVPRGKYAARITGTGIVTYIENFDVVAGDLNFTTPLLFRSGAGFSTSTPNITYALETGAKSNFNGTIWFGGDTNLYRSAAGFLAMDGGLSVLNGLYSQGAGSNVGMGFQATGDTGYHLVIRNDGRLEFGDGSGPRETNLYREQSNVLRTDSAFRAVGDIISMANNLRVISGASIIFDSTFSGFNDRITGIAGNRMDFFINGNKCITFGNTDNIIFGAASDTNLYRSATNTLKTDSNLIVAGTSGHPAISSLGLITATPGVQYSDATVQISAIQDAWKDLVEVFGASASAQAAGHYIIGQNAAVGSWVTIAATPANTVIASQTFPIFPLKAADYTTTGRITQVRLVGSFTDNTVAPSVGYTFGIYPIANGAGGVGAISAAVSTPIQPGIGTGTGPARITSPAAALSTNFASQAVTWTTALIPDGNYALGVQLSGAAAANSVAQCQLTLQYRFN